MNGYTVSLIFKVKPNAIAAMEDIIKAAYDKSLKETGCQEYRFYACQDEPSDFLLFMVWSSRETYIAHVNSPHVEKAKEQLAPILREPTHESIWEYLEH